MSESLLSTYRNLSPNYSTRQGRIVAISIHCTAGNKLNTAKQIVNGSRFVQYDPNAGASTTYAVGGDGSVAQGLSESKRQWCTSNRIDHWCVTIEVASNKDGTDVTPLALQTTVDLCVDICKRNGIKKLLWDSSDRGKMILKNWANYPDWYKRNNLIPHRYFSAKSCPGDFLFARYGYIADEVNKRLNPEREDEEMDINKFLNEITDEQAFYLIQKANQYQASLPEAEWSKKEGHWQKATESGIVDGTRPEAPVKRCEMVAVLGRKNLI